MSAIDDDLAWFDQNRDFIFKNYANQWVLVKDKSIKGAYPTQQAAMTAGFSQFKTQPFVVKQALAQEPEHHVLRGIIGPSRHPALGAPVIERIPLYRYPNPLSRGPMLGQVGLRMGQMMPQQQPASPIDNLAQNGALLQAQASIPSSYAQGGGSGTPQTLNFMIDSGASISCITMQAAQQLNLPQVSSTQLGGVGGMTNAPVYAVRLVIPQFGVTVDPVQIAGVANPLPNVDGLVGRDILRTLVFTYNGGSGNFQLAQSGGAGTPAPTGGAAAPAPPPGQPSMAQSPAQGQPPVQPAPASGQNAPPPPPAQQNLPQPSQSANVNTVLGMPPSLAAGVGAGILAVSAGALKAMKIL